MLGHVSRLFWCRAEVSTLDCHGVDKFLVNFGPSVCVSIQTSSVATLVHVLYRPTVWTGSIFCCSFAISGPCSFHEFVGWPCEFFYQSQMVSGSSGSMLGQAEASACSASQVHLLEVHGGTDWSAWLWPLTVVLMTCLFIYSSHCQ